MVEIQSKSGRKGNLTLRVFFLCLGIAFLSLRRSIGPIEHCGGENDNVLHGTARAHTIPPQHYDDKSYAADSIRPNIKSAQTKTQQRPCLVAVTNSATYHFEILESVATQLPLQYLNLDGLDCDKRSLIFDYFIVQYVPPPTTKLWKFWKFSKPFVPNQRSILYRSYFESKLKGKTFVEQQSTPDAPLIIRTIGKLTVQLKNHERNPIAVAGYDATIEASCLCSSHYLVSLHQSKTQSCIFHAKCPPVADHPRAVWVSPHHAHFFIPTALPSVPLGVRTNSTEEPICLCVIGSAERRSWELLEEFLRQMKSNRMLGSSPLSVKILGLGNLPAELNLYKDMIQKSAPSGDWEFHRQVAADCDAMLLLLTKTNQPDYFLGPNSLLRLTGALPLVMAYHKPVLLHEDLYTLYKEYFPSDLLAVTHTDEATSFVAAMWDLLNKLS